MKKSEIESLWKYAATDILGKNIPDKYLSNLASQTFDSIRRIQIYKIYRDKAFVAAKNELAFYHTSNPFILAQRPDLNIKDKIWILYLATYFGKSNKSKWVLFNRSSFRVNQSLITFTQIRKSPEIYYEYLNSIDLFEGTKFSNHRKYTKKSLNGSKGLINSMNFMIENMEEFNRKQKITFSEFYKLSHKIPGFGRLASFDFTSTMAKCELNVEQPLSMYANNSTGPLKGLFLLLSVTKNSTSHQDQIDLSEKLTCWFLNNSHIFMVAQVLEDAICNWQKSPIHYERYFG